MMAITFHFEIGKAIEAMVYLVDQLGKETEKLKLIKLLYLADREHFLSHGRPITGDRQVAMPYGPVPSTSLDLLNGNCWPEAETAAIFQYLKVVDNRVQLRQPTQYQSLTEAERHTLDSVLHLHRDKTTGALVSETHQFTEWKESYEEGTSRPIPYESILKASGDPRHFRSGRPVISSEMAQHLNCPFQADSDL